MKKFFKIFFLIIVLGYLLLYFSYKNGYYKNLNHEKKILTEEKIKEYEEDLKKGIDTSQKDYIVIEPSYGNTYTRSFLRLSKTIENSLDKTIKFVINKLSRLVDD